ncbi:MAG: sufI, partial [Enterovirga sp.]|nr:sufI [Enterovirga sp.]
MNDPNAGPTRRLVALGLAVSLGTLTPASAQPRAEAASPAPGGPGAPGGGEPRTVLLARPLKRKLLPGAEATEEAETWAFADDGAVPVLRFRKGEEVSVRLVNETPSPLSLHWGGVRGPNAADGVAGLTQPAVAPGASFDYRFTPPDPGTFLLRPLAPGHAGEAAGRGLAGLLVVEEPEPPAVAADHVLLVWDRRLEPSGAFAPFGAPAEAALAGRLGNRLATDAGEAPKRIEVAPGTRIRLRAANASNARIMRLRFDGLKVFVAAVDSQPADNFEPLRASLPFPPGTRYDLMIEAPAEAGAKGAVVALIGEGVALAEIVAAAPSA